MMKSVFKALVTVGCCMVFVASRATADSGEDQRRWLWLGTFVPDCEYPCDPQQAGCATNPDCKCDCFR